MRAKYSDGLRKNVFHIRCATDAHRENQKKFEDIYESGEFKFSYQWNWGKVPEKIVDYEISGIACGKDGYVYASSRFTDHPIVVFDYDGRFIRYIGSGLEIGYIHGISLDNTGYIWYTDIKNHVCRKINQDGELIMTLGNFEQPSDSGVDHFYDFGKSRYLSVKKLSGPFNCPTKIITAPNGNLYASDGYCNCAVHRFTKDGKLMHSWGAPGEGQGEFSVVHGLAADEDSRIWVADRENNRVQVFDQEGEFLILIDQLMYPSDIAIGGGYAYVSELDGRISIYNMDFELVSQIGGHYGGFHGHSISIDACGNLYIGQMYYNYHISRFQRLD